VIQRSLGRYQVQLRTRQAHGYHHVMHHWHDPAGLGVLICLHGVGVAAELTWEAMAEGLQGYRDVYCPDLRGMGRSYPLDDRETAFTAVQVAQDVRDWLDALRVTDYDLVGYSFGGLIALLLHSIGPRAARLALIESALLERADLHVLRTLRGQYAVVTDRLLAGGDPTDGVVAFLDLVAPNRSRHPRVERITVQRLAGRPAGFAYALRAVNQAAWDLDRDALLGAAPTTLSVLGGKSRPEAHALHLALASARPDWSVAVIPGVDHALPYQKPRQVADCIMKFFRTTGSMTPDH